MYLFVAQEGRNVDATALNENGGDNVTCSPCKLHLMNIVGDMWIKKGLMRGWDSHLIRSQRIGTKQIYFTCLLLGDTIGSQINPCFNEEKVKFYII